MDAGQRECAPGADRGIPRDAGARLLVTTPVVVAPGWLDRRRVRVTCEVCGEGVNYEREIVTAGRTLCRPCAVAMAAPSSVVIDGRSVVVPAGTSVLEAARLAGVIIPALCDHPALPVDGSCRLCLVEIAGRRGLHPSCALPVADGLHVATETPAVVEARQNALRLLLARYRPGAGRPDNELLALAGRHGVALPPASDGPRWPVDESNPFIRVDREACIHCWRCVRACSHLNGVTAIGVFGRGQAAHIGFGADGRMQDSTCEFCGMCEAVCPTDALLARDAVPTPRAGAARSANTVCSYCGVGCRLDLILAGERIVGAAPDWNAPANHGLLCVKGRFGWPYVHHRDRLTRPRVRRARLGGHGQEWVDTDWEAALDLVAKTLTDIAHHHGPDALGFLASAKCTNGRTTWSRTRPPDRHQQRRSLRAAVPRAHRGGTD